MKLRHLFFFIQVMLRTMYFYGNGSLSQSIQDAEKERDNYIANNHNFIDTIDSENIQFINLGGGSFFAIITLSFYPKKQ